MKKKNLTKVTLNHPPPQRILLVSFVPGEPKLHQKVREKDFHQHHRRYVRWDMTPVLPSDIH
jgi:hypothetical protein